MIFVTEDIGKNGNLVAFFDQAHRDTRNVAFDRHAGIEQQAGMGGGGEEGMPGMGGGEGMPDGGGAPGMPGEPGMEGEPGEPVPGEPPEVEDEENDIANI